MFRCQSLQSSSCCFRWKTSLLLLNRVLSELWLKRVLGRNGKPFSSIQFLDSNPPQTGEDRKNGTETELRHCQKENSATKKGRDVTRCSAYGFRCLAYRTPFSLPLSSGGISDIEGFSQARSQEKTVQNAVRSGSLFPRRSNDRTSAEQFGGRRHSTSVSSEPWNASFCKHLAWKNSSYPRRAILDKSLLRKTHWEEAHRSSTNSDQTHVCNVKSGHKKTWSRRQCKSFHGNLPPRWTMTSQVSATQAQSRSLHQGAAVPVRTPPGKNTLKNSLSAENETRCRRILEPNLSLYHKEGQGRWAAVLVSLCLENGEPAFLFTLRSSLLKGRHKGDVSFAGGKRDPSDQNVIDTALREAREELGITVAPGSVWGVLKPRKDMSGMIIAPVIANLGPLEVLSFRPNPAEVEEIFTISLSHLCCPENRGYTHFRTGDRYGYTVPVFRNGKHRVWGLTAIALDHTLKLMVHPQQPELAEL